MFSYAGRICVNICVFFINVYRFVDRSGLWGPHTCRFSPSCSVYFEESLRRYGFVRGTARGLWRLCRCNPINSSWGHDPVVNSNH